MRNRANTIPRKLSRPMLEGSSGDGSTLSLDFKSMSSLDSRFTFARPSNATFTDSNGIVTYAAANLAINTAWVDSNTTPTGWSIFNNGEGTAAVVTIPSSGRRSMTVTSGVQSFIHQVVPALSLGLRYSVSIVVHSVTGAAPTFSNLISVNNSAAPYVYYKDGSISNSGVTVTAGTYTVLFTSNGSDQIRIGSASGVAAGTYTLVVSSVQLQIGEAISPAFIPNYSTSAGYFAPRFDFNPTTLAPKGLLLESAITNIAPYSSTFSNAVWTVGTGGVNDVTRTFPATGITDPAGTQLSCLLNKPNTSNGYGFIRQTAIVQDTLKDRKTISCWFKPHATTSCRYVGLRLTGSWAPATADLHATFDLQLGVVSSTTGTGYYQNVTMIAYPNGWYRCSATTGTFSGATGVLTASVSIVQTGTGAEFSNTSGSVYIWGLQVESGLGATSHIPTGSTTVARSACDCKLQTTPTAIGMATVSPNMVGTCAYSATINVITSPTWAVGATAEQTAYPTVIGFFDNTNTSRFWLSQNSSGSSLFSTFRNAINDIPSPTFTSVAINTQYKLASSISTTFNHTYKDNTLISVATTSTTLTTTNPIFLQLGYLHTSVSIGNFKFFPTTKTTDELKALTA